MFIACVSHRKQTRQNNHHRMFVLVVVQIAHWLKRVCCVFFSVWNVLKNVEKENVTYIVYIVCDYTKKQHKSNFALKDCTEEAWLSVFFYKWWNSFVQDFCDFFFGSCTLTNYTNYARRFLNAHAHVDASRTHNYVVLHPDAMLFKSIRSLGDNNIDTKTTLLILLSVYSVILTNLATSSVFSTRENYHSHTNFAQLITCE